MADLPSADHNELFNWEIYDESRHLDDGLIWLSSDEEAPTLVQTAESFKTLPLDTRDICGPEAMASDHPAEHPILIPVFACHPSSNPDVRFLPRNSSASDGSAGFIFGSLLPSHKTFGQFTLTRRLFRVAALVTVLLIGSVLPSILGHLRTTRVKASAAVAGRLTQSAGRPMSRPVRVLTVMAGQQETLKDISIRYVGHFDDVLFEEIRRLNPDLKDPDHLEDGQLIRIPLRTATAVN
jgi:LysM domain